MSNNSNQKLVPESRNALSNMKFEIAKEFGINLKDGYNGDLTAREAGTIGGEVTKRLIKMAEQQLSGQK